MVAAKAPIILSHFKATRRAGTLKNSGAIFENVDRMIPFVQFLLRWALGVAILTTRGKAPKPFRNDLARNGKFGLIDGDYSVLCAKNGVKRRLFGFPFDVTFHNYLAH